MRVVASVQAKRGSSRGLVHYIAHSKLDAEREPENVRELFNAFADSMSVTSSNNSMRIGIAKGRPSNDELHHLVLSFRPDDYRKLGKGEKQRGHCLKEVTREAMKRLKTALSADRLSWAAALHLNTNNPHVHIALQKQYFTTDLERETLTKIPREALPHFEVRGREKVLIPGILIEAATEKMDHLIDRNLQQTQAREKDPISRESISALQIVSERERDNKARQKLTDERDTLRRGIIAEYELRRIESRITALTDHGDKMRFLVSDSVSGRKGRFSLRDLEQGGTGAEPDAMTSPERQIRTILLKMLGKEEAEKERIQSNARDTIREADRVRSRYRKMGRKLPVPSFTKDELDKLQEYCMDAADIRRSSYLEGVRSELERSREIEPRSRDDLRRIAAQKTISDLTIKRLEKDRYEFDDRRYYRPVDAGDRHVSLAQLDREERDPRNPIRSLFENLKNMASRSSEKERDSTQITDSDRLRNSIVRALDEQKTGIEKELKAERNKTKVIEKILKADPEKTAEEPLYSTEQLADIDALSLRLKQSPVYEKNWDKQRTLIESATSNSPAARKLLRSSAEASLSDHKTNIIAGRALAREIVAKAEFKRAKDGLKTFTESKRFHKFAIADKDTGSVEFVCLHDVDLPSRGSLLDRALDEIFEGKQHRSLRRTVTSLVKDKEQGLKQEVAAAKDIMASASQNASEFKQFSFFGLASETSYQPIFTSSEIRLLESRAANTRDLKEAARLRAVLESASDQPARSLKQILRDFENPEMIPAREKEHIPATLEKASPAETPAFNDPTREPQERRGPGNQGHSR
ncbi:relaxase MobL [Leptolyngbya sp. 7M]|uniref:relaxase MobL n=1 Tax=Leptolyngbya sp. 7M TaxID=2812896 RepID=UPI001B8AFDD8|nr:relaxase MobL [Leptolyngbya sp. 7M]QYO66701.1 relaxase MobL [Leptolyngbya sp. 7M]